MWKSIALTGACHIPSLRADRSLCLILKGCYVWKRRLTPQPQCQHSDKQDDICATLFHSASLCMLEIGRSAQNKGEEEGAGCVGEESNYPHLRGSLRLGPCGGVWCDGLALTSFSLSHLLCLSSTSRAASSIARGSGVAQSLLALPQGLPSRLQLSAHI